MVSHDLTTSGGAAALSDLRHSCDARYEAELASLRKGFGVYLRFAIGRPAVYRQTAVQVGSSLPMLGAVGDPLSCLVLDDRSRRTSRILVAANGQRAVELLEEVYGDETRPFDGLPEWAYGAEGWLDTLPSGIRLYRIDRWIWIVGRVADLRFFHAARLLRS